jgi:predicted amidohydrolase YtcJ
MLLANGVIRTMDPDRPVARELEVEGERVAAVGQALDRGHKVDLSGLCVVPGLADAHVHFPTWSMAQREVRLEGARSLEEVLRRVAEAARTLPGGAWLRGTGWRPEDWVADPEATAPSRQALDRAAGDRPVALMSKDYHSLWLNSAALSHAGELEVPGGVVERDADGEPSGVLREAAAWAFRDEYVRPSIEEMVDAVRDALPLAAARGVTAVHDKDGWLGAFEVFERLLEASELTIRVWQSFPYERLPHLRALGLRSGFGNEMLRVGYLKVFMDGTLGSATARLLDGSGTEITSRAELELVVRNGAAAGFPVGVHAIGDAANRAALDALEATRGHWQPLGLRPRIEHAQLLAAEDVQRFARLGVAASVQFSHAPSDRDLADRLWEGRSGAYAYRSLRDAGALLANGSDAPVEELDPLRGIRAGALRTLDEREPWHPEQRLSVEEALEATTIAPAWLARDERRRGTLSPGKLADVVVLDRDPVTCPPEELADVSVVATMLGGRWVHNPPPW